MSKLREKNEWLLVGRERGSHLRYRKQHIERPFQRTERNPKLLKQRARYREQHEVNLLM